MTRSTQQILKRLIRFNLNIASLKMVGDCLTNLESKVNSAEGNISTSESTHSKNAKRLLNEHIALDVKKECGQSMGYKLPQNIEFLQKEDLEEVEKRLFTFMDERECQKKLVQNILVKQSNPHSYLTSQLQENNASLLNVANLALQKIILDSKKKREDCSQKILNVKMNNKSSKSTSRLTKISTGKTPKATKYGQQKYDTIQSKSRSKTPKFQKTCNITPKYNKQAKLFRAKSNLQKDWAHVARIGKLKKETKQLDTKKQMYQIDENGGVGVQDTSTKALLRKKKELERQLQAVNETITSRKKKTIPQGSHLPQTKKAAQPKHGKNRKKSISKPGKYQ